MRTIQNRHLSTNHAASTPLGWRLYALGTNRMNRRELDLMEIHAITQAIEQVMETLQVIEQSQEIVPMQEQAQQCWEKLYRLQEALLTDERETLSSHHIHSA